MSVRKRIWKTSSGETKESWLVLYSDSHGDRCQETFGRKKDADARQAAIRIEMQSGVHVASSKSPTVATAAEHWLRASEQAGLERSTLTQYRQHVILHINPMIGHLKLAEMTAPEVRKFEDRLRSSGRSPAMVKKVVSRLGTLLTEAQERGLASRNPVRDLSRSRKHKTEQRKREKGKLRVGEDVPTGQEVSLILSHAQGRWRPLLVVATFTGLRSSELRGLRWSDVDFKKGELHIRQRADRYNKIGKPKSASGERTVPFGKVVSNTLKEWKLACPRGDLDLVFPNGAGKIEDHVNIIVRGLIPAVVAAGVVTKDGKAKYTGLHTLRHFYASWCINRVEDGGQGLPAKVVQERMGHSKIAITFDTYGHLFPRGDDGGQIDAAELRLIQS